MLRDRKALKFFFIFFLFTFSRLFAQNTVQASPGVNSLADEISRLEKTSGGANASGERYNAFMSLARLFRLSGNPEAALKAYEGALTIFPGNGQVLFEQGRLLISLGEFEKAAIAINVMFGDSQNRELIKQGRFLGAMLEAFRSGNTVSLATLADDNEFSEYKSAAYYTLWILSGLSSWKNRLAAELPQSPEAKIANGLVASAITPHWLLFPGRASVTLASAQQPPASPPVQVPVPAAARPPEPAVQEGFLQTGLFSREENARTLAARLLTAGFEAQIKGRTVNGSDYWAVYVPYGKDMNAEIMKLKNAGFEAFPVKQ